MPAQHYLFAHRALPSMLWEGDRVIGILANPENQDFLVNLWNDLPQSQEFMAACKGHAISLAEEDPLMKLTGEQPESMRDYCAILPSEGLSYAACWLGEAHLVYLVRLPPPTRRAEAHYICITTSPGIRYFTFEKSMNNGGGPCAAFCEWTRDGHAYLRQVAESSEEVFLGCVCDQLGVPQTVGAPVPGQLKGLSKGMVIDMAMPAPLSPADARKEAEWALKAAGARQAGRHAEEEAFLRKTLELRMEKQGPANTEATLAMAPLVNSLVFQGRHAEAEALCREWWGLCRRYRMPGHQETMFATNILATCLRMQNRKAEMMALLEYRVELAGLARGRDSVQAQGAMLDLKLFGGGGNRQDGAATPH